MKKIIKLTENDLSRIVKLVINEGVLEDITPIIDKTVSDPSLSISDLWDIKIVENNTISISPKGMDKPTKIKIDFPGKDSFKLQSISKYLSNFGFQVSLLNKDFPLSWGIFKNLPGSGDVNGIRGFVFDQRNQKWVKQQDVKTTFLGKIDYGYYGYKSGEAVKLQFNGVSKPELLRNILLKLKNSKMRPFQIGIEALDVIINLKPFV